MPTYVYSCQSCGRVLECRQSFSDAPLAECDDCGGELRRVLQPVGIIFRGSGFYSTDYRSASSTASGDGRAAGKEDGEAASDSQKPAAPDTPSTTSAASGSNPSPSN